MSVTNKLYIVLLCTFLTFSNKYVEQNDTELIFSNASLTSIDFSSDENVLVAGDDNGSITIWKKNSESKFQPLKEQNPVLNLKEIKYVDISNDGKWVLSIDKDGKSIVSKVNLASSSFE